MSGANHKQHTLESDIKSDFIKYCLRFYPTAHVVIIPASAWRLLPYDAYIFHDGIFAAVELKVDDNTVAAHQYQALYAVTANRGYSFVVRWMNIDRKFIVENFTTGTAEIFRGTPSNRQLTGRSVGVDADDKPFNRKEAFKQMIDYIMGFTVSPLESAIQEIIKKNNENLLKKIGRIK